MNLLSFSSALKCRYISKFTSNSYGCELWTLNSIILTASHEFSHAANSVRYIHTDTITHSKLCEADGCDYLHRIYLMSRYDDADTLLRVIFEHKNEQCYWNNNKEVVWHFFSAKTKWQIGTICVLFFVLLAQNVRILNHRESVFCFFFFW